MRLFFLLLVTFKFFHYSLSVVRYRLPICLMRDVYERQCLEGDSACVADPDADDVHIELEGAEKP